MAGSQPQRDAPPFVWPPGRAGDDPPTSTPRVEVRPAFLARALSRTRDLALNLEAALLPQVSTPLVRRLETGALAFDSTEAYCDRCGADIGPHETEDFGCSACAAVNLPWDRFVRLGAYEGALSQAVREVKFRRFRSLGVSLGEELGRALVRAGARRHRPVLVPIPTTPARRLALGLDHTLTLARGASRSLGAPVVRALGRRPGPTQLDVAPSERPANVARVFLPRRSARRLDGCTAILLDDVCTTGATLRAASRALARSKGARPDQVWSAVVSVATHP